jgi:hypothetical protein
MSQLLTSPHSRRQNTGILHPPCRSPIAEADTSPVHRHPQCWQHPPSPVQSLLSSCSSAYHSAVILPEGAGLLTRIRCSRSIWLNVTAMKHPLRRLKFCGHSPSTSDSLLTFTTSPWTPSSTVAMRVSVMLSSVALDSAAGGGDQTSLCPSRSEGIDCNEDM